MLGTLEKIKRGEKAFIVCLGDSITEQNYHLHEHLNYVGLLSEKLINKFGRNHLLLNAGVSGDTTWGIVERLERDALRFKPDLVTLMIGMNDSTRGAEMLPEFRSNLEAIIDRTRNIGSEIVLITQNTISYELTDNVNRRKDYPAYVKTVLETAESRQVPVCDLYQAWTDEITANPNSQWTLMNDGIHPNEYGHRFMADGLFRFMGIS